MRAPPRTFQPTKLKAESDHIWGESLTSATGQDVASLPAGRAGLPHAVMFPRGFSSPQVCAAHLAGLEAVAAAGGCARCPWADSPVESAGLCGAVLQGAGPANGNTH